jgi:hypothetical protein
MNQSHCSTLEYRTSLKWYQQSVYSCCLDLSPSFHINENDNETLLTCTWGDPKKCIFFNKEDLFTFQTKNTQSPSKYFPLVFVTLRCNMLALGDGCPMFRDSILVSSSRVEVSSDWTVWPLKVRPPCCLLNVHISPSDMAPHPRRISTSTALKWKPQNLHVICMLCLPQLRVYIPTPSLPHTSSCD